MQDTGPVLQRLQLEAYRAVCRAMAVAPLQYVSCFAQVCGCAQLLLSQIVILDSAVWDHLLSAAPELSARTQPEFKCGFMPLS